jgi:hypothetical protein
MLTLRETGAVRKALILVSDGDDNYSHALESDAIKECQRAETIVYAISTNVSPSKDKGDDVLQTIAEATGGQAFYPTRIEDVANGFTTSRKSCAASTCWSTGRRTSSRTAPSAPSICRRTTRATRCARATGRILRAQGPQRGDGSGTERAVAAGAAAVAGTAGTVPPPYPYFLWVKYRGIET